MAVFQYLTKNSEGDRKEGEIRAESVDLAIQKLTENGQMVITLKETDTTCLLYTSPSPRDATLSRMPSSA